MNNAKSFLAGKTGLSEEIQECPDGALDHLLDGLADDLVEDEEEEEEPSPVKSSRPEAEEAGRGVDLIDTYLKSVGKLPMLKIEEEKEYVRMLEEGRRALKAIALSSSLAFPRVLALGAMIEQGSVKAQDVLRYPGEWNDSYEAGFMVQYNRLKSSLAVRDMAQATAALNEMSLSFLEIEKLLKKTCHGGKTGGARQYRGNVKDRHGPVLVAGHGQAHRV